MSPFTVARKLVPAILVQAFLVCAFLPCAFAQGGGDDVHAKVAEAILSCESSDPGALFKAVKAANPSKPAIVSIRELNKALSDKALAPEIQGQADAIIGKQKAAQRTVREKVLATRDKSYSKFRSSNQGQSRSIYGSGDIGSWPNAADPDASMDIDWTVFGVDPDATAGLRDQCKADLVVELAGEDSGLTLADFDVVITAEGHERAAGVFETEGGIDWAKRNMKRVTINNLDGTSRTYELGTGDPIGEMANAEHMAKFRELATKGGDYEKLFDEGGNLRTQIFDDPGTRKPMEKTKAQELWNKYMDMLSSFGVDYYITRTNTATGGCLDMAKHLQEEVISKKHEPKAKLKKTLKYVARGDNISGGVPGLREIMATDPILGDAAYRDVIDLARKISGASSAEVDAIIKDRFGDTPDAGLQELGNKARRAILRMAEVSYQAEMDRIVLEIPDQSGRQAALDKLSADMGIVSEEGGDYTELAKSAIDNIAKMSDANKSGAIDDVRKNYTSLEKIRQADQGIIKQTTEYLKQTELGKKMLDMGGKLLEIGQTKIIATAEPQFRSQAVEVIGELVDSARAKSLKVVELAGSLTMWAEVVNNVRTAKSDADLAVALGKTLVNNTFFGMVLNTAYAGIVQGDNDALAKAIMYMLVPETALPALVEALGNTAINVGAQTLFDAQMQKVYDATTFDKDNKITDFSGLGMNGPEGSKFFVDTMCDGAPEMVAQDLISKSKATDFGAGANAIAIKTIAKSIRSTVDNGTPLIFTEDGPLMKACAGIRKCTEDINDCAKIWGIEVALAADNKNDLPSGLDIGQTRALIKLMGQREGFRKEARAALADAMVRTFEERRRAEASLDGGKAKEEYDALLKLFEDLGISKEGAASLEAEGAPYNLITNWTTSTREKQITAVKAVQKFKDAYTIVLQTRTKAESAARNVMGDSYTPEPRPLTNSLPLTSSPDLDVQIAKSYIVEVAGAGESTLKDLGLIKKADLEGTYDESMVKKLYELRFKIAYYSAMMKAASDAQQLHWDIEIFDKQALHNKHTEAFEKISELRKQEAAVLEEFKKHYELGGEFVVTLTGPEQVNSGEEAKLVCAVKIKKTGSDSAEPVPDDIAKQFKYAWASGKADLGEDAKPERAYKLDTPGEHAFTVTVKRTVTDNGKQRVETVGQPATCTVKVGAGKGVTVAIDGPKSAKPGAKIDLKATLTAEKDILPTLKMTWKEGETALGDGAKITYSSDVEKTHKITVIVSGKVKDKEQEMTRAEHEVVVSKSDAPPPASAKLTAKVVGVPEDAVQGGTIIINAADFRSGGESYSFFADDDETGGLGMKWSSYWQSTHKKECEEAEKSGVSVLQIVPPRPAGWGVETVKITWKSDPSLTFAPAQSKGMEKSSAKLAETGKYAIWGDIYIFSSDKPEGALAGETEKAIITVGSPTLTVKLSASKTRLKPGEIVNVTAITSDGKAPYTYRWTGDHAGDGAAVSTAARRMGPLPLSVEVTDSEGRKGSASVTMQVEGVRAALTGVESKVIYGTKGKLGNKIEGEEQSPENDGLCKKCGKKLGSNKDCLYCVLAAHDVTEGSGPFGGGKVVVDPNKAVSIPPSDVPVPVISDPNSVTVPEVPDDGPKPSPDKPGKRMIVWQSEPALTFNPPKSEDGKTTVVYDRVGTVKLWTEILELEDGVWQTVGETEQVEIEVAPPNFAIAFDPEAAKTGKEVKATVKTSPDIPAKYLNYVWFEPGTSNRMEYEKNASVIGFKLKDAKPVTLKVEARVPFYGDTLADNITATFTPSQYLMTTKVTGSKPQIWKEGVGLVDVENAYAVDQNIRIRAEFVEEQPGGEVRYQWTVNEGTTLGSSGLGNEVTVSRHEVGSIEAKVQAKDSEGAPLGNATAVVQVTVSANDLKNAKEKSIKIALALSASKTSAKLGESVKFTASVTGGKAPFRYSWTGDVTGQGASATMKADEAGSQTIGVTVTDTDGRTATKSVTVNVAGAFAVNLTADKTSVYPGDTVTAKASASAGKAPYTYKWSGTGVSGTAGAGKFVASEPGDTEITVTATDAKKRSVKKSVKVTVQGIKASLEGLPEEALVGSEAALKVNLGEKPITIPLTIKWFVDPAANLRVAQTPDPSNYVKFDKAGRYSVYAEVFTATGKSLAKTDPKSISISAPTFKLDFEKQGEKVVAKLTPDIKVDFSLLDIKWLRPSGASPSGDGDSVTFTPIAKAPTDVLVRIKIKQTSETIQEIKSQYEADADKSANDPKKDKTPGKGTTKPGDDQASAGDKEIPEDPVKAQQQANQQIEQAGTLAANGKIDEALALVDKAGKVLPEKAEAKRKSIGHEAAIWTGNAIADLDFDQAKHLADIAIKYDPNKDEAKAKQAEVQKWSDAWDQSKKLRPDFDKFLSQNKVVSAEKAYMECNKIIGPMPAAPKVQPILYEMMDRWAKARDAQTLAIQPHRRSIMEYIKSNAHENALPLVNEVLEGKVVVELYPAQEEEFKKWKGICEKAIEQRKAAATKKTGADKSTTSATKPDGAKKPDSTKKPDGAKKPGNILDDIDKAIGKINDILGTPEKKPDGTKPGSNTTKPDNTSSKPGTTPSKPTVVVDVGNPGACQFTDRADFTLKSSLRVTQVIIWASWDSTERSMPYKIFNTVGESVFSGTFARGQSDTYQKNWCNGVDEPNINLPAGTYRVKIGKQRIGQNSGTGGNGMIKVVTGGLLVPASGSSHPVTDAKPTTEPKTTPKADPVPDKPKTTAQAADVPLKPKTNAGSAIPTGWVKKVVGNVTVYIPGHWSTIKSLEAGQAAWYTGDMDVPDAGFGVLREGTAQDLLSDLDVHSQASITVSGMPATSYIGKAKGENIIGWLVEVRKAGSDGKPIYFIGAADATKWTANKPTLEKILGTVRIGGAATKGTAPPKTTTSAPKKTTSGPKMIEAIFVNQASQNVHFFLDGQSCDPSNRVTPGQSRHATVTIPADGRIKFCAGRNGSVIARATWNGDPDNLNRIPKVIFDSSEKLLVVTSLK